LSFLFKITLQGNPFDKGVAVEVGVDQASLLGVVAQRALHPIQGAEVGPLAAFLLVA